MASAVRQCFTSMQRSCAWRSLEISKFYCTTTNNTHQASTGQERVHEVASVNNTKSVYVSPTGWAPPTGKPAPLGVEPDIPFRVRRSMYKQLPVYSDYRNGRTRILTRISKIDGDIVMLEKLLRQHLQIEHLRSRVDEIAGSIIINGDHRIAVRKFLKELGF